MDPLFRFCPRCGAAGLEAHDGKWHSCAPCGLQWYRNPAVSAGAILEDAAGRVLLVRRAKDPGRGTLGLPGGFIDFGETAEVAVRREVREEIGIRLDAIRYLASFPNRYEYREVVYPVLDLFFVASIGDAVVGSLDDEVAGVEWWDPEAVPAEQLAFDSVRRAFEVYREERRGAAAEKARARCGESGGCAA